MDLMATNNVDVPMVQSLIREGDELKKNGQLEQAIDLYLAAARAMAVERASVAIVKHLCNSGPSKEVQILESF